MAQPFTAEFGGRMPESEALGVRHNSFVNLIARAAGAIHAASVSFPLRFTATAITSSVYSLLSVLRLPERREVSTAGLERRGTTPVTS